MVCVIWDDAHANTAGEFSEQEIANDFHKAARFYTYGLLARSDDKGITVVQEECDDGTLRGLTFVPRGMVIEEIDLGLPKRKKKKAPSI